MIDMSTWDNLHSLSLWWRNMSGSNIPNRKDMASLTMLVGWNIWNERNARIFRHKSTPTSVIFDTIKREARLWVTVGAHKLGNIMPGE